MKLMTISEKNNAECELQYKKALSAGTAAKASDGKKIFIGTAEPDDEAYETSLFRGVGGALNLALGCGYKSVLIDAGSFGPDQYADYFASAVSDAAEEWRRAAGDPSIEVYVLRAFRTADESLLQRVADAVNAPKKVVVNHFFGDGGDPLIKEFEHYLEETPVQKPFREYLLDLIKKGNYRKCSDVYKRAGISKSTFSKITNFSLNYKPSKSTVAALAIGLQLDLKEAQKFFHAAGYHLGTSDLQDRVVRFFIESEIYDIYEVNCCLHYYELPLLGERSREPREER